MSLPAFYLEAEKWGAAPELGAQETRHAQVLRLKEGDQIQLMDGMGRTATARIERLKRQGAELSILEEKIAPRPVSRPIIAMALSKAVRRGFFMEKASELGAAEIWLWQADFSQGKLTSQLAENLKGQLIAGMKQSRNPWLPEIKIMAGAEEAAKNAASADCRLLPWEEIGGSPILSLDQLGRPGVTVYAIGPEGGFSARELEIFKGAGFSPVSLGERVLRCETAASLCLGLHWWAAQLPGKQDSGKK